jgi:hypothetical protein
MTREHTVEDRDLYDAFRPLHPEREDFLAGVERRIVERQAAERNTDPEPAEELPESRSEDDRIRSVESAMDRSPFLRAAASLLPPGFLPTSVLVATGQKLTLKAAPALLAMPAILLVMFVLTFVGALFQVRTLDSSTPSTPFLTREEIRSWWWSHRYAVVITLIVLGVAFWFRPADALVGLLLLSLGCLTLILRRLSAAGFASRKAVGVKCGFMLMGIALFSPGLLGGHSQESFLSVIPSSSGFVLLAGALVCFLAACNGRPWQALRKPGDGAAAMLIVVHLVPVLVLGMWPVLASPMGADDLRRQVEGGAYDLATFRPSMRAALWLRRKGVDVDLSALEGHLRKGERVSREDQVLGMQLGIFASEDVLRGKERQMESWRRVEIPRGDALRPTELFGDPRIHVLASSGEMTAEERATLTGKTLAAWPEDDYAGMPLQSVRGMLDLLDALGTADQFEPLVPRLHALLVRLWIGTHKSGSRPVGFLLREPSKYRLSSARSTLDAVLLMERFGVPEGVDGRRVRGWLEGAAKRGLLWQSKPSHKQIQAAIALDVLRDRVESTEAGVGYFLVQQRVLVATLLLVLFCCIATLRAPRSEQSRSDEAAAKHS